ncbi:SRPBCC domain-containing protein [Microbacterium sp. NPDC055910]|uniref:SRPBCC domain-containing protein n=1 Tax=Microbacterium sp. NPDC055910 TaxID=3345659 RepID=UPI0035DB2B79
MRVDRASRFVAASPDAVYRAFVDPALLVAWLPPAGMTGHLERFDAMSGYRMRLAYGEPPTGGGKASADEDVTEVRRVEVVPGERVVEAVDFPSDDEAYSGTMTMRWTLEPVPGGTRVVVEAVDVPRGVSEEDHAAGLASSLENLGRLVVAAGKDGSRTAEGGAAAGG